MRAILVLLALLLALSGCQSSGMRNLTPEQKWGLSSFSAQLVSDGLDAWFAYCEPQNVCITTPAARESIRLAVTGVRVLIANVQAGLAQRSGVERLEYLTAALEKLGEIERELVAVTPDPVFDRALASPRENIDRGGGIGGLLR